MRMIDADRRLRELTALSHGSVWPGWTYEGIKLLIDRQPTLTPPNEWVNVEERLPETNKPVLVYCDGGFAVSYIFDTDMLTGNPVWNYTGLGGDPWYWTTIPTPPDRRPPEGEA